MIIYIENEIRYKHSVLSEVFQNAGRRVKEPYGSWLAELGERLEAVTFDNAGSYSFNDIWEISLEDLRVASHLKDEDIAELATLGQTLGYMDVTAQQMGLTLYLEELRRDIERISASLPDKTRVSVIAGTVGGILIVILLL